MKSPKTSISGIIAILGGLGAIGNIISKFTNGEPVNYEEISLAVGAIVTGIGLLLARDNNVSSEAAGVR